MAPPGTAEEVIRREIESSGAISFAQFMNLALYAPAVGYYSRPDRVIGRSGDFYTSVSVGPALGFLLASRFAAWGRDLESFNVVEAAAHDGQLAHDILSAWSRLAPATMKPLRYGILEPSETRRAVQRQRLAAWESQVEWWSSWDEVPTVRGVVFANELLDALPVRRFGWDAVARAWFEWGVTLIDGRLSWCRLPAPSGGPPLPSEALRALLPDGIIHEVCPAAEGWWQSAAAKLAEGRLVTLDYGTDEPDGPNPSRWHGTLRGYHQHQVSDDLLARPGEQDLTAHVAFRRLMSVGEREGLLTETLMEQGRWLGMEVMRVLQAGGAAAEWLQSRSRQVQTLMHPQHLGRSLRVLVQRRER